MVVQVRYTKTDPEPSLTREEVMVMMGEAPPEEMAPPAEPSRAKGSSTWVLLLGGMLLVAAGGFIWYQSRSGTNRSGARRTGATSRPVSAPGPAQASTEPEVVEPAAEFCTQCGTPLKADARFCHVCGASLE
jgi:hypothetical protein